jgi:hypothetical protein
MILVVEEQQASGQPREGQEQRQESQGVRKVELMGSTKRLARRGGRTNVLYPPDPQVGSAGQIADFYPLMAAESQLVPISHHQDEVFPQSRWTVHSTCRVHRSRYLSSRGFLIIRTRSSHSRDGQYTVPAGFIDRGPVKPRGTWSQTPRQIQRWSAMVSQSYSYANEEPLKAAVRTGKRTKRATITAKQRTGKPASA